MKTILFTGATGGLGRACVEALSRRGYRVFAAGTNREKLAELSALPGVIPLRMDVTDEASVTAARASVGETASALDAIVNFAGLTAFCSMVEGDSVAITEKLLAVNVTGTVRVNRAFFDLVRAGKGRIINCSSEAGWMKSQPFAAPYFLSKHAVESYSDSLRRELMYLGIPVVVLEPGSFRTELLSGLNAQYEATLAETRLYRSVLTKMKPLMTQELNQGRDPKLLARTLLKAVEAPRPRLRYRVGTGKLLLLLEFLPDSLVDFLYRNMLNR